MGILLGMPTNHGEKNLGFLLDPEQTGSVHPGMVSHQSGCGDGTRGYIYIYIITYVCVSVYCSIYIYIHVCIVIYIYIYYYI